MSGIAGIVDLRGAPVDTALLQRMTRAMEYRGPDRLATWADGAAGFGHTLLRTTMDAVEERQPCTVDGRTWIVADARLDARRDLVEALESTGRVNLAGAADAHLILHAYAAWGEACAARLLGDFAFAIWDGRERRLFCARDRFGIKPFYYAHARGAFVFSNTLGCVRLHPAVGDALNERAVGDFLLFGFNEDTATTTFADVQRLPPAHTLTIQDGAARRACYWTLPTDGRIRYRRADDYIDHFSGLLRASVDDRLRGPSAGVWMSGGLDSTSIAATAKEILSGRGRLHEVRAYSIVYDDLLPDRERRHAGLAARALGLPIHYFAAGRYAPFNGWADRVSPPEPACDPFLAANVDQMREAAGQTRVLLCGDGGDEILTPSTVAGLVRVAPHRELAAAVARSCIVYRQRPAFGIKTALLASLRLRRTSQLPYPAWLDAAFEARCGLRERWARHGARHAEHAMRPDAYRKLTMPLWPSYFEWWDPGWTGVPVEGRYPFFDVRLIEYLMAIPPIPWCVNKQILRESVRGRLPEAIRRRPKTPLAGDPLVAHLDAGAALDQFHEVPELARFVDRSAIPPLAGLDQDDAWLHVRPLCLNYWLKQQEGHHGADQTDGREHDRDEGAVREPAARRVR